jgi:pimeloyl-ACP methyl ester carboxylesterase
MRLCVWCREELPFARPAVIRRETDRYPGLRGRSPAVFAPAVCGAWGVCRAGKTENRPVTSKVPVLLISGEYDADTPPAWAQRMAAGFANRYHLVFKGMGHTPTQQWPDPCAMQVARAFFNNPGQPPLADCYRALPELQFTVKP